MHSADSGMHCCGLQSNSDRCFQIRVIEMRFKFSFGAFLFVSVLVLLLIVAIFRSQVITLDICIVRRSVNQSNYCPSPVMEWVEYFVL